MRTKQENTDIKEASFKASKSSNKKKNKTKKEHSSSSDISKDDQEMTNFFKRLNKGTHDRYKGKASIDFFLIVMLLVIFIANFLIRKVRRMMKVNQIEKKNI
jgi:hypothetical protein